MSADNREGEILLRLAPDHTGARRVCGFYHPSDHPILFDLERRGLIETSWGQGRDRGLVLARLKSSPVRAVTISTSGESA